MNNTIAHSVPYAIIQAADRIVMGEPKGYAINPGPVRTKTPLFAIWQDRTNDDCFFVLVKWMDNTGVFLRYPKCLVVLTP